MHDVLTAAIVTNLFEKLPSAWDAENLYIVQKCKIYNICEIRSHTHSQKSRLRIKENYLSVDN